MLKMFSIITIILFLLLFLIVLVVYLFYMKRADRIETKVQNWDLNYDKRFENFTIKNPYKVAGEYYKGQLHTHTTASDGKIETTDLIEKYKNKGYNFLAITDHNKITINKEYDDESFITIQGEELTIVNPFWPLGRHLNRLFISDKIEKNKLENVDEILNFDGINVINHPATISGLGTQRWDIDFLLKLDNIKFIEIANHFSDESSNIKYWHILMNNYGKSRPIWAFAVDDSHRLEDVDKNWIKVKADEISVKALKKALKRGSFYCTQGPDADFFVHNNLITVKLENKYKIKFIDAENKVVKKGLSKEESYKVQGDEGFIRIEIIDKEKQKKMWSQPFWLVGKDEVQGC